MSSSKVKHGYHKVYNNDYEFRANASQEFNKELSLYHLSKKDSYFKSPEWTFDKKTLTHYSPQYIDFFLKMLEDKYTEEDLKHIQNFINNNDIFFNFNHSAKYMEKNMVFIPYIYKKILLLKEKGIKIPLKHVIFKTFDIIEITKMVNLKSEDSWPKYNLDNIDEMRELKYILVKFSKIYAYCRNGIIIDNVFKVNHNAYNFNYIFNIIKKVYSSRRLLFVVKHIIRYTKKITAPENIPIIISELDFVKDISKGLYAELLYLEKAKDLLKKNKK